MIHSFALTSQSGQKHLAEILNRFQPADSSCRKNVAEIIDHVRSRGDTALVEYTRRFDDSDFDVAQLRVTESEIDNAYGQVDNDFRTTLALASERIETFHQRELEDSWFITRDDGTICGRLVRPVDAAGLYVPGGQGGSTPLVSSVLMNGIPARIAGVEKRIMVTPPGPGGRVHPALLVAAREIGIKQVFRVGSAWAVAALAFGTETIPAVDVIVGPGNQYVTEAKSQVSGRVRIDMIAGPSEVLIIADHTANPAHIAADMLAQAEHDPQALAMVIVTQEQLAQSITSQLEKQLPDLSREQIARQALLARGVIFTASDLEAAIKAANGIGPEHLELMIEDPWLWLPKIRHAGAIFLGANTPEAAGDYLAGPNHVLPTMGTARVSSALGVETFVKKSSIISYSRRALLADSEHIERLARLEGLTAHARSVTIRTRGG